MNPSKDLLLEEYLPEMSANISGYVLSLLMRIVLMVSKKILMKMKLMIMIISGNKFVIKQVRGVRKQFLILHGEAILGFVRNGKKFADCDSYTKVTTKVGRFGGFSGILYDG